MLGLYVSVVRPCGIRLAWVRPQAEAGHAYPALTVLEALPMILAARLEDSRQHLVLLCVMNALLASLVRETRQCPKFVQLVITASQGPLRPQHVLMACLWTKKAQRTQLLAVRVYQECIVLMA
jgi:hypothetical protein